jgi:hypothetical protein
MPSFIPRPPTDLAYEPRFAVLKAKAEAESHRSLKL